MAKVYVDFRSGNGAQVDFSDMGLQMYFQAPLIPDDVVDLGCRIIELYTSIHEGNTLRKIVETYLAGASILSDFASTAEAVYFAMGQSVSDELLFDFAAAPLGVLDDALRQLHYEYQKSIRGGIVLTRDEADMVKALLRERLDLADCYPNIDPSQYSGILRKLQ